MSDLLTPVIVVLVRYSV